MELNYTELVKEIFSRRETPPLCCVHSYGCQQNVSDGEKITGMLCRMGCGVTYDMEQADVIILNTCAVRENAELKVYGNVGELKHLKEKKARYDYRTVRLHGSGACHRREDKKVIPPCGYGVRHICFKGAAKAHV